MKEFCVYILLCNDGSYYTGLSSNLEQRLNYHHSGYYPECYTFKRRPLKIVYIEEFQNFESAMLREKQIKGWSRRKKQALIDDRIDDLFLYSKNFTEFGNNKNKT